MVLFLLEMILEVDVEYVVEICFEFFEEKG